LIAIAALSPPGVESSVVTPSAKTNARQRVSPLRLAWPTMRPASLMPNATLCLPPSETGSGVIGPPSAAMNACVAASPAVFEAPTATRELLTAYAMLSDPPRVPRSTIRRCV
jgi:hypothetical protein